MSDASPAVIEKRPFALQVERAIPDSAVANKLAMYQSRGLPVYALMQANGTARLFAGAFKTKEEGALLAETMRAAGLNTPIVYRTGRVY